ncbi:MAG TPA: O-antigen ligase family protein [Kiritimatiellia bacterium]|nr:O-antigen ligase family protein [Kiritimatiellia bacterium]
MNAPSPIPVLPAPGVLPAEHPASMRYGSLYWNVSLTRMERWILPLCICFTMLLQLKPVLYSAAALPMILVMSALCWMTPTTGFFYIACAQFLPYPEGAALNPAQIGVVTWIAVTLLLHRRIELKGITLLWPVIPWLVWHWLVTGEPIYHFNSEYVKALTYSVIACQQVNAAKGRYLKCLLGMCLGTLMATTAFWAFQLGLPVDLSTWGGERSGHARLGGVRADAVMIWPPLLMGCFGVLGIALSAMVSGRFPVQIRNLRLLTMAAFFISIPPLVATMTHGAYAGFAMMIVFVGVVYARMKAKRMLHGGQMKLTPIIVGMTALLLIVYLTNAFKTKDRIDALYDYYQRTADEYGAAASRTDVWEYSLRTILKYPLLGIAFNDEREEIPPEYADYGNYLSHNVFLDYGRWTGLPGMIAVSFFFFHPLLRLWRRSDNWRFIGFYLFHFALLIFWMSLSFQFYKTFWGFWMLAAMVADREPMAVPVKKQKRVYG